MPDALILPEQRDIMNGRHSLPRWRHGPGSIHWAQVLLLALALPAVLLAIAAGALFALLAGLLSLLGLADRQPRAPWRSAGVALKNLLRRAAG